MTAFHESIKSIFADIEKFLVEVVKKDCKLSKRANDNKQQILDKLHRFYEEHPEMKPALRDNTSANDDSSMTGGSSNTDDGEDASYIDVGINLICGTDLNNPVFSGYLEKKQKKGSGLFGGQKLQPRWCALHAGVFYYYTKPEDKRQCGAFRVEGYRFRNAPDVASKKKDKELAFELYHEDESKRTYQFVAKNKEDYESWKNFLDKDSEPLIEEDIYEEVGADKLPEPVRSTPPAPKAPPVDDGQEIYEDPETEPPPPPRPPLSSRQADELPPPPPPPTYKGKPPVPEPVAEDIYDDATSAIPAEPPRPPPPLASKRRPHVSLPEIPTPKKQIKLNLTFKPEEDFENKYYGMYDCKGDNSNELSFKKGDIIHIISKDFDDKSWWIGELNGKFGLVPKTYVTAAFVVVP